MDLRASYHPGGARATEGQGPWAVHSLRHTKGANLRKRGADIRDIQEVLYHADIGTTLIYTQMAREDLREELPKRFIEYQPSDPKGRSVRQRNRASRPGSRLARERGCDRMMLSILREWLL